MKEYYNPFKITKVNTIIPCDNTTPNNEEGYKLAIVDINAPNKLLEVIYSFFARGEPETHVCGALFLNKECVMTCCTQISPEGYAYIYARARVLAANSLNNLIELRVGSDKGKIEIIEPIEEKTLCVREFFQT